MRNAGNDSNADIVSRHGFFPAFLKHPGNCPIKAIAAVIFSESDLDALDLDTKPDPEFTFFSVDFLSFPNIVHEDDILVSERDGTFDIYADGPTHMGIDELDDLDALILFDVTPDGMGGFIPEPNGILDPELDQALFSLNTFSPSTFTFTGNEYIAGEKGNLSPADILYTNFNVK